MHGSTGGRWKRSSPAGHLRFPGRCAEKRHHDGLDGSHPADSLPPRQRSTLHENAVGDSSLTMRPRNGGFPNLIHAVVEPPLSPSEGPQAAATRSQPSHVCVTLTHGQQSDSDEQYSAPDSAGSIGHGADRGIHQWSLVLLYGPRLLGSGLTRESADAIGCLWNDPSARAQRTHPARERSLGAADRLAPTRRSHRRRTQWAARATP
jgi:hypothetical protein